MGVFLFGGWSFSGEARSAVGLARAAFLAVVGGAGAGALWSLDGFSSTVDVSALLSLDRSWSTVDAGGGGWLMGLCGFVAAGGKVGVL